MADTRGRQAVKITDPTTNANELGITAGGSAKVDIEQYLGAAIGAGNPLHATIVDEITDNAGFTDGTSKLLATGYIFDEVAGTALTENDAAAARVDSKRAQVLVIEDTTTRGQRAAVTGGNALKVDGSAVTQPVSGTVTADTELTAAAALADTLANPTITNISGLVSLFNGTTWDRARSSNGALADALANPGTGLLMSETFLMGYNGSTWDRVRTANTGRLQVDVITGGGSDTPTSPVVSYQTSASLAAGSAVALTTAEAASTKLSRVTVWASVPYKVTLTTVDNAVESGVKGIGGGQAAQPCVIAPRHRNYVTLGATAGLDAFRVNVTNLDSNTSADVYAVFEYES